MLVRWDKLLLSYGRWHLPFKSVSHKKDC